MRVGPTREAAVWFDEQLKGLRASLENAQAKLTDYHQREGIVSSDERYDVENARLAALSEEATRAQASMEATAARICSKYSERPFQVPYVFS